MTGWTAESKPRAPSDVVQPRLNRRLKQPPRRLGRLDVPVSRPSSVPRELLLVESKKRVGHGVGDIADLDACEQAATLTGGVCRECRVLRGQRVENLRLLTVGQSAMTPGFS